MIRRILFHYFPLLLLFTGIYYELAMQTFKMNVYGPYDSPIVWMGAGLLTCVAAWCLLAFQPKRAVDHYPIGRNRVLMILWGVFALGSLLMAAKLSAIFATYPVDAQYSDIIPSLELYVKRWMAGEKVYAPFQFPTWVVLPTYFPLLWMPYGFSEYFQIDYRWTAYIVFLLAVFLYFIRMSKFQMPIWELLIKAILPFVLINYYIVNVDKVFGHAVELLPVGFYLLLTLTLFHRSTFIMGLGILLCLLSRYAFTFWLPIYLLIFWIEKGFMPAFKVGLWVLAGVLLLYVLPFLAKDWTILTNGLAYYSKTAEGQWMIQSWQEEGQVPHHLNKGLSFAMYFYDVHEYEVMDRLAMNRKAHLVACGIAAVLLFLGYLLGRKRGLNVRLYMLVGLKFYLVIFYGFFYVPFSYLYMLPFFLSLAIVYELSFLPSRHSGAVAPLSE
ncbi:MAG: hypothetical protein AAFP19_16630 [Bacteroidota bacterium]